MPEVPRCQTAVPGDSCLVWVHPGSISIPVRLLSRSEGPRGRLAVPGYSEGLRVRPDLRGHSHLRSRARRFDQLSQATGARVRRTSGSTSCLGRIALGSEGPRVRPAIPVNSLLGPRARGVDQMSGGTRACFLGPAGSTTYHSYSGLGPRARGVDQLSRVNQASVRMCAVLTTFPGDLGFCRRVRVVDQTFGRLRPMPEGPRFQPASWATLDRA